VVNTNLTSRGESGDVPSAMEGAPSPYAWAGEVTAPVQPQSRSELDRIIWALAWPVIITYLLESLVGLIDTLMVGRLGATALAAVGVGAQVLSAVSVAMTAVGTGTMALVARHVGAREAGAAERVLGQSIVAAFGLSVLAVIPMIAFAAGVVGLFGVDPPVVEQGGAFVRMVMLSIPQSAVLFVIGAALRGAGDTRTPLFIGIVVNILNVVGNYVLIFGKFGAPTLGVPGSALATTIAFTVGTIIGLVLLARGSLVLRLEPSHFWPSMDTIRRVLVIGYPTAGEQMLMQIGFFFYLYFAARYGTSAVAAYFIGVRILALSFLPGFGFGAAAAALVGQNLGAQDPQLAERSGWQANRLAVYVMSACGVIIFVAARPIAALFVDDPDVVRDAVSFIRALAAAQPLMGIDFTLGGALRGAGDTRFPLLAVCVGFYGCRLACAYLAAMVLHLSLPWVWFALMGDYVARAALKGWRFQGGRWKHIAI
jgi:putative MATE family efflux protein